jgi:hypothetical protein
MLRFSAPVVNKPHKRSRSLSSPKYYNRTTRRGSFLCHFSPAWLLYFFFSISHSYIGLYIVFVPFHFPSQSLYSFFRCLFPFYIAIYFLSSLLVLFSCFNFAHSLVNIAILKTEEGREEGVCIEVLFEHSPTVIGEMNDNSVTLVTQHILRAPNKEAGCVTCFKWKQ